MIDVVAAEDGKRGCPVMGWIDGIYKTRCCFGIDVCHKHGRFAVVPAEPEAQAAPEVSLDDLFRTPEQILDGVTDRASALDRLASLARTHDAWEAHGLVPVPVGWLRALDVPSS